ncbi:MAG: metallophosphoesterase [Bacteroidota bacterium]|nr:metallophosphoesterase [Bacteroidota bacterium]
MRWVISILFIIAFQWYAFQGIKTITNERSIIITYWFIVIAILGNILWHTLFFDRSGGFTHSLSYSIGFLLSLLLFQGTIISILFFEDIMRLLKSLYNMLFGENFLKSNIFPGRRKFISQLAVIIASIPTVAMLYGIYKGRYNYKVLKYTLEFDDLPKNFDGFTITQISDIHCGSLDNYEKVSYGIDLINQQNSDLLLFTGDIVNNRASELKPWISLFSKLRAPYGNYSVLGNHDYGDYVQWKNKGEKKKNMEDMKTFQKEIGFELLLNESRLIKKDGEHISLIGLENWGKGGFKKSGDLKKSIENIKKNDFKIVMTHDPSHWEAEILPHPFPFQVTLSGHTHGFQFGIEIPGWIKWSPSSWRYKQWAGIYEQKKQIINVNRGFGFLAYPGRVGIWPEVTVIELKRKNLLI